MMIGIVSGKASSLWKHTINSTEYKSCLVHTCGFVKMGYLFFHIINVLMYKKFDSLRNGYKSFLTSGNPPTAQLFSPQLLLFIFYHEISSVTWKVWKVILKGSANLSDEWISILNVLMFSIKGNFLEINVLKYQSYIYFHLYLIYCRYTGWQIIADYRSHIQNFSDDLNRCCFLNNCNGMN